MPPKNVFLRIIDWLDKEKWGEVSALEIICKSLGTVGISFIICGGIFLLRGYIYRSAAMFFIGFILAFFLFWQFGKKKCKWDWDDKF